MPVQPASVPSLDSDDASRLSFLAYTLEHFQNVVSVEAPINELVGGLKTPEAQKIAEALRGRASDQGSVEAANVFRGWVKGHL
jgi:hypothetical protein